MPDSSNVLTSWKEIASYLGKGVRTVQRWERELSLPVRRPENGKHVVIALRADLDVWVDHLHSSALSAPCCNCKVLLDEANAEIAALRAQIARLEEEIETSRKADGHAKSDGSSKSDRHAKSDGRAKSDGHSSLPLTDPPGQRHTKTQ